ncbi:biotin--[acetyl-CoA-carboxylase] ligase [delta proteobacterium NaphS2]|nr:biotin--[acetyl-CoA-carboxylase] ligase [delta proteobacterium NaphS2]
MEVLRSREEVKGILTSFNVAYVADALKNSMFGKNIIFEERLGSTNVFLKKIAQEEGAAEGTVVIADEQTDGLGRMGRRWFSKKGENLLFSVLLRPTLAPDNVFILTMIFALAGTDALKEVSGLDAGIKWPNDIYLGQKKLGGVLTEFSVLGESVQYLVLGMGLNVNWKPKEGETTGYMTSSVFSESGKRVSREELLVFLLGRLAVYYQGCMEDGKEKELLYKRWNKKSVVLGRPVVIETGKERIIGNAAEIDQDGALWVVTSEGEEKRILCGDVSVKVNNSDER